MSNLPGHEPISISVPYGTSRNGSLLCLPARWTTLLRFFALNYVAHAFTIWTRPGESIAEKLFSIILALFFPVSGLGRGLDALYRHASFHTNGHYLRGIFGLGPDLNEYEIYKAARAGALGILIRNHIPKGKSRKESDSSCFSLNDKYWTDEVIVRGILKVHSINTFLPLHHTSPAYTISVRDDQQETYIHNLQWTRNISGVTSYRESSGYKVVELPYTLAKHIENVASTGSSMRDSKLQLSQNSSLLVSFLAALQIVDAAYALSRVTHGQLEDYGYSAFNLTVIPYLVMSFINLLGNLATPTYPNIYLVSTTALNEAKKRTLVFQGTIGFIQDAMLEQKPLQQSEYGIDYRRRIVPYSCSERRDLRSQDRGQSEAELGSLDAACTLDWTDSPIRICFNSSCESDHCGNFEVPSGRPGSRPYTLQRTLFKLTVLLIAISAHIVPTIWVGPNYEAPRRLDHKLVGPLWIVTGYAIGFWLLFYRFQMSILSHVGIRLTYTFFCAYGLTSKQKAFARTSSRIPILWLLLTVLGITIAVGNFYVVATQIFEFGNCINVSDSM
ncbi:hypothetical protein K504DRAFT_538506 [Pleomassaria siparia CBS 279.74]|uniref:Uncharacterized protein n=1 Tax=Pleomassaria siparia CBS 279.74 TaxID=1314801 RepID=A0A6G1JTW0_9PLEO|nr:hypothetical protein K504DRAFT_538506 [Pleomassaria siparia CBS 279.74]